MHRFHWLGVWILFLVAIGTLAAPALWAAPFLTGSSEYYRSRIHWQVFAGHAADNPQPKSGEYTYLYWIESLEDPLQLYSFNLYGPNDIVQFGAVTGTGYLPGTGIEPINLGVDAVYWQFSVTGIDFPTGARTATLYLHSPDEPGAHDAVPYSCNPLVCDPVSGFALGPITPTAGPADYNGDGAFSVADYETWKSELGNTNSRADGNRDGIVDTADYTVWRNHFIPPWFPSSIPEPASAWLFVIALVFLPRQRRQF